MVREGRGGGRKWPRAVCAPTARCARPYCPSLLLLPLLPPAFDVTLRAVLGIGV
jgi:hypothetical protein